MLARATLTRFALGVEMVQPEEELGPFLSPMSD
jgi:hypothetical protein